MTSTEQLIVPLGATTRIKHEAKITRAAETAAGSSSGWLFTLALALAVGTGLWVHSRTLDIANAAAVISNSRKSGSTARS